MKAQLLQPHFDLIANEYRKLRTTDDEPVRHICDRLDDRPLIGLDVGAGTGRYTERLLKWLTPGSVMLASDLNPSMLRALSRNIAPGDVRAVRSASEQLPFATSSLDLVTTFNAVHHFELESFADEVARILKPGGHAFVYTRTPSQNASSIWGQRFPGFNERETRMYAEAHLLEQLGHIGPATVRTFTFPRRATPARLTEQVRGHHYSTFSLYTDTELEAALEQFLDDLGDAEEVSWDDANILVHAQRAD